MALEPVAGPPDALTAALERLYGRERGNKGPFTLAGTRALLDALGRPDERFRSIHIAGTNGKGSTAAILAESLGAAFPDVGLFTSPHLVDFRERIRIRGRWADAGRTAERLDRIAALGASAGRTFFEVTFALAALTFAEEEVDYAVLETGLGGRLDSTNVVTPVLCVITPIGMDHMDMLGPTLADIAREKAGILKPGVPVVVAPQLPEARTVIDARAREVGAPVLHVEDHARVTGVDRMDAHGSTLRIQVGEWAESEVTLSLLGRHQWTNLLTAALAFHEVTRPLWSHPDEPPPVARTLGEWCALRLAIGAGRVRWPGRFEASSNEPRLFWDGAHNAAGAQVLREAWRDVLGDPPAAVVLGFATDKDAGAIVEALAGPVRRVFAVAANSSRAASPAEVARVVRESLPGVPVTECASVADGVRAALASLAPGECALACGSLFVVGEAMQAMGEGELECL